MAFEGVQHRVWAAGEADLEVEVAVVYAFEGEREDAAAGSGALEGGEAGHG